MLSAAASVAIGSGLGAVVGVPLLAYSADLAAAGINQAATGEQTNTFFFEGTKKTAKGLGASEETANNIAIGTDIVVGAALTGGSSNTKYIGTIPKVVAGGVVAKGATGLIDDAEGVLSKGNYLRIQNAATRINKPITVVGSRASGTAKAYSDWDYVIPGLNNRDWSKIKNSLPGSRSILDNTPRNIDIFKGPVDATKPHIIIYPRP